MGASHARPVDAPECSLAQHHGSTVPVNLTTLLTYRSSRDIAPTGTSPFSRRHMRLHRALVALVVAAAPLRAQTLADAKLCERAILGSATDRLAIQRLGTTRPATAVTFFARGCTSVMSAKWDSAAAQFNAAATANPRSSATFLWVANTAGQRARMARDDSTRLRLAPSLRDNYAKAIALDGANIDAREGLMQYFLEAPANLGGDRARAAEQAEAIARLDAFRGLGARLAVANAGHESLVVERLLTQATTQFPDSVIGWANLSSLQADGQRPAEAYATITRWQARGRQPMFALFAIGRTAAVTGAQAERGIQALQQYLRGRRAPSDPPLANAHYRLAQIYERVKNVPEARAEYQLALKSNPRMRDAQLSLDRLR